MNELISNLFAATLTFSAFSVYAATTPDNIDDGSNIGTSESPQHKQQSNRTDKGPTEMSTDAVKDDGSNLGTAESPQHVKQNKRTDKGAVQNPSERHVEKNKVMQEKDNNKGTTKGNQIQPTEPENAAPAVDY
ncbi:MAG TPA: hypothetical protein VES38_06205 [Methylotenera sp.]|nr:hypothetical protein [Methylotenera sp.]